MSAKTPRYQLEYPTISDRVADAPAINQRQSQKLEELLTRIINSRYQGRVSLGQYQPNQSYSAKINFARPFRKTPNIAISCSNQRLRLAIYDVSPSGFTYFCWNDTNSPNDASAYFDWIASIDEFND